MATENFLGKSEKLAKKVTPLALLGALGIGLSLFCNLDDLKELLTPGAKKVLDSMNKDSSVAPILIESLPDEKVVELARGINSALKGKVDSNGKPLRACKKGKPHWFIEWAVQAVYNRFNHLEHNDANNI